MKNVFLGIATAALAIVGAGCSDNTPASNGAAASKQNVTINGAGASFPAPVYQNWTHTYSEKNAGITINYQSLGSGAGMNQLKANTIDFAGSDNPLTVEEQKEANVEQFPMLTGGVVVIVNVPGVKNGELKLSRAALSEIFLGKITKWNDPKLLSINPELKLPELAISVVRRADASGTSFIFTNYLSKISPDWQATVGCGSSVKWPVGIGAQKNPGVCNNVVQVQGSIGYTEYTYAVEANLTMAQLENQTGKYIAPSVESFTASAANADWQNAPGFYMVLTDQPGADSWPITGVTYVMLRKDTPAAMRAELIKYFNWCFADGGKAAVDLNYVPIPANVVKLIQTEILK